MSEQTSGSVIATYLDHFLLHPSHGGLLRDLWERDEPAFRLPLRHIRRIPIPHPPSTS